MEDQGEKKRTCRHQRLAMYFSIMFLAGSLFIFLWSSLAPPRDSACIDRSIAFTPLREAIHYRWANFGDHFYPKSVYRGPSTPRLEQAWQGLIHNYEINIPDDSVKILNQSTSTQWKRHRDGGVAANVAGFHQLSCLNIIRLHVHADLDDQVRKKWRIRVDDCIELLREKLMCEGDATPFLIWNNPKRATGDGPDFSTKHKCRDWNALEGWADKHAWGW